jgi:hypothetical protein
VYDPDQVGGYYHACPEGTQQPRDENVVIDVMKSTTANGVTRPGVSIRLEGRGRSLWRKQEGR